MSDSNKFEYTYTAPTEAERREIKALRDKYTVEEKKPTDFERLKALDKKVYRFPTAIAIVLGVVGTLIFGTGMTAVLQWSKLVLGCAVSALGLIPLFLAYPVYKRALENNKTKYGEEIRALSDRLLGESKDE